LIAEDWKRLAAFYETVFGCTPISPERNLSGRWLDKATGLKEAQISGIHLELPGYGDGGPTLELFQYGSMPDRPKIRPNTPGFSHIAFAVDDVAKTAKTVFDAGGCPVGDLAIREIPGAGVLTFQYVADPEGNIIEIQNWKRLISIRKADENDAQAVWDIRNDAINSQCTGHYPPELLGIWTAGEMTDQFVKTVAERFYVATLDDHVVGTGMIDLESGEVGAMFVHPSRMRTGVGRRILTYLESLALEAGLAHLSLESTLNAAPFYRACGFAGETTAKYKSPRGISLNCIPMKKSLRDSAK